MVRLRNDKSGVVVSVADDTATRLGSDWVDADVPVKRRGRPKKSEVQEVEQVEE